jgi:cob(I)alamin adenosyltransferase
VIYTRRGDGGDTDLFGGSRVSKHDLRVEAYGSVDEANAMIGVALAHSGHDDLRSVGREIQARMFDLGGYLATPDAARRAKSAVPEPEAPDIEQLERQIDAFEAELEPLKSFILPGGTPAAAAFHAARTACRRAERRCVALHRQEPLSEASLGYVNRLSDLLFVMARVENRRAGVPDIEWQGRKRSDP